LDVTERAICDGFRCRDARLWAGLVSTRSYGSGNGLFPDPWCLWDQADARLVFWRGVTDTARAMTAIMNGP